MPCARGVVLVQGPRPTSPFDIYTDRKLRYRLKDGAPDPAFLAADRATLAEMARREPASLAALGEIAGVGAKKLEAYGPAILDVLAAPG